MYEKLTILKVIFVKNHKLLSHWGNNWKVVVVVNITIHFSNIHMPTAHVKLERVEN